MAVAAPKRLRTTVPPLPESREIDRSRAPSWRPTLKPGYLARKQKRLGR